MHELIVYYLCSFLDVVNNFFNVSLNEKESKFKFTFQSNQSETICSVASGPHKADCRNNIISDLIVSNVTGTHLVQDVAIDISFLGSSTKFCFIANASTRIKTIIMSGIYDTGKAYREDVMCILLFYKFI